MRTESFYYNLTGCDIPIAWWVKNELYPISSNKMQLIINCDVHVDKKSQVTNSVMEVEYVRIYKKREDCNSIVNVCQGYSGVNNDNVIVGGKISIPDLNCSKSIQEDEHFIVRAGDFIDLHPGFSASEENVFLDLDINTCNSYFKTSTPNEIKNTKKIDRSKTELTLFPNPTVNKLIIKTNGFLINDVSINDINGKQVLVMLNINKNEIQLNLIQHNLPKGIYTVSITSADRIIRRKLVIN